MVLCKLDYWKLSKIVHTDNFTLNMSNASALFTSSATYRIEIERVECYSSSPMYLSIQLCLAIGLLSKQSLHLDFTHLYSITTPLHSAIFNQYALVDYFHHQSVTINIHHHENMDASLEVMDFWPPPDLDQKWARHLQTRIDIPPEPFKTCLWHHHQAHNPSTLQFKTIYCIHE